jgi:hypothetical protein
MKSFKILLIWFLLNSAFYKSFAEEVIPPCPLGFDQMSVTVPVGQDPTCTYTVYFCFKCNPNSHLPDVSYVYEFQLGDIVYSKPPSESCIKGYAEVEAAAIEKITNKNFIDHNLCGPKYPQEWGDPLPPCENTEFQYVVVVDTKLCKIKYKDPELDVPVVLDCPNETLECHRVWKICWESSPPPGHYEYITIEGPTMRNGTPYDCDVFQPPQYPLYEPYDPSDGNYSECFRVWGTPCTPFPPGEE